jgi:hypothetical protein
MGMNSTHVFYDRGTSILYGIKSEHAWGVPPHRMRRIGISGSATSTDQVGVDWSGLEWIGVDRVQQLTLDGSGCHAPCARHDISAPIDLIPTHPFVRHYHDVGSYPCDSPYDPKPPDIIPVGPESDWIFETRPAAALRYICSRRLGFDFGIMFHTSYLRYLILESWLHVSFCFHFTI